MVSYAVKKPVILSRVKGVENRFMVSRGHKRQGISWEIGIDIHTLLYIK